MLATAKCRKVAANWHIHTTERSETLHKLPEVAMIPVVRSCPVSARRTRSAALLAGVSAVLVLAAGSPAQPPAPGRRTERAGGRARTRALHGATLDLYALDSQLARAQAKLARLR